MASCWLSGCHLVLANDDALSLPSALLSALRHEPQVWQQDALALPLLHGWLAWRVRVQAQRMRRERPSSQVPCASRLDRSSHCTLQNDPWRHGKLLRWPVLQQSQALKR
jgi:hypothetical protein